MLPANFQTEYGPVVTVEFCGIGYNPDLVPEPSGYKVLFEDPAYEGMVSLGGMSNTGIMAFSEIASIFGDGPMDMDSFFELVEAKKDHLGPFVETKTHQMILFQQKEIAVFMACTNNVAQLQALGVNAQFATPETGIPAVPVVIHMTKGAFDPDAVYAYMDAAISASALTEPPIEPFPTNSSVDLTDSIKRFVTKDKVKDFVYLDWVTVAANREDWTKTYDRLIATGYIAGWILTFDAATTNFVTPTTIGGARNIYLPQYVYREVSVYFDWPTAGAISLILGVSTGSFMLALAMLTRHPRLVGHV